MPAKKLWQTKLTDLEETDVEGMSKLREGHDDKMYRWVKNASATALIRDGCCLMDFTTTLADVYKRVRSSDVPSTGPSTCLITMPAGSPETGIAKSGASTGDHGWIQCGNQQLLLNSNLDAWRLQRESASPMMNGASLTRV